MAVTATDDVTMTHLGKPGIVVRAVRSGDGPAPHIGATVSSGSRPRHANGSAVGGRNGLETV